MIYRTAEQSDYEGLAEVGRRSFIETFGTLYKPCDLEAFLQTAFGPKGLPIQIDDPAYHIRLAIEGEEVVGYCKLGACTLPIAHDTDDFELKQLYIVKSWQGTGVAPVLMDWALDVARERESRRMLLSVWAENHRAKRFYARYGFREVGQNPFRVGDHIDDDRIWSLDL